MITKNKLKILAEKEEDICISIYIKTHRVSGAQKDRIRYKNALQEVHQKLIMQGKTNRYADQILGQAFSLLDDDDFWLHLSDCLAVFISARIFDFFLLPVSGENFNQVGERFYLRPLYPVLSGRQRFFLLALSQSEVRFFEGNQYRVTPVMIDDLVPTNLEEALSPDDSETTLQAHSSGRGGATFHGQGGQKDERPLRIQQYLRQIDAGLMEMLHDEQAPLIIAAVDYLVPMYREVSAYPHILQKHLSGNPEKQDPVVLHQRAWPIMAEMKDALLQDLQEDYQYQASQEKADGELTTMVGAARNGKIDTLFVNQQAKIWEHPDHLDKNEIAPFPAPPQEREEVLDLLARETFLRGGKVYVLPPEHMPDPSRAVNAIYRY